MTVGKRKTESKAAGQSGGNSQSQIDPMQSPQMLFSSYSDPRGKFVYDSYVHPAQQQQQQQYFVGNAPPNGYQQGPYLTITQFNYQPAGFQPFASGQPPAMSTAGSVRPSDSYCRYIPAPTGTAQFKPDTPSHGDQSEPAGGAKKCEADSEASGSFEYTIQPEQLVKSLCDEREYEGLCAKGPNRSHVRSLSCGSPRPWPQGAARTEDDQFTKCLAQGCLQAEAIAVRNQNRPCFKNIKHLCTRTRTDILKPKTTVANIHSQGIPWATKDFIFAYIRLINCWHILSGYLENDEGSLGKIDTALTPAIREKYYRWKTESKELLVLLNNLFLSLDKGVTIQNAEIFSKYNNLAGSHVGTVYNSATLIDPDNASNLPMYVFSRNDMPAEASDKGPANFGPRTPSEPTKPDESCNAKENLAPLNVPGILIVKEMFSRANPATKTEEADAPKEYIKPGTYIPPESAADSTTTNTDQSDAGNTIPDSWESLVHTPVTPADIQLNTNKEPPTDAQKSSDSVWKNAIQTTGSFIKRMMNNAGDGQAADKPSRAGATSDAKKTKNTKDIESWVTEHCFQRPTDGNAEEDDAANTKQTIKFKKHVHCSKGSNKKNVIGTRVYKKRSDDRDTNNNKVFRYKNGNKSQNKYLSRKSEAGKVENDGAPKRPLGLAPPVVSKFEKIIHKLWLLPFSKFVTFEVNAEYVPDYYKHVCKPMFLCNVMNSLKQNKYRHVNEVVHDLRTIVWNSELYIQKRPDWWFEKCLQDFSSELESQIANKFANVNFGAVSGDPSRRPVPDPDPASRDQK